MSNTTVTPVNPEKIRDNEYCTVYAVPATLRQIETAGIELAGGFGIDAEEHAEMLDEAGLLRLTFGVELTDDSEVAEHFDVECFDARIGQVSDWRSCSRIYHHPAGNVERNRTRANRRRIEDLLATLVPDYPATLAAAAAPFNEWVESLESGEAA